MELVHVLCNRLYDDFQQEWHATINEMSKRDYYKRFQNVFSHEPHLD